MAERGMQSVECDFIFTLVCCVYFYHVFDCSYEIQLCEDVRRKGLGKFLMQILELMAFKYAILMCVFHLDIFRLTNQLRLCRITHIRTVGSNFFLISCSPAHKVTVIIRLTAYNNVTSHNVT